jgi:phosphonatase-like hydrolase
MKINLVVFDMAGTTVHDDDAVSTCLRHTLASAGVEIDRETVNRVMGEPKPVAIAKLLSPRAMASLTPDDPQVREAYATFERLMLDFYEHDPMVRAVEGAAETFHLLKASGIRVALDTGFNRAIADAILRRLDWLHSDLIDVTVTSDEVARGRPYPDLIRRAMLLTGVPDPAAVAKVGDTPADLREGTAAGCSCVIGITTGSHTRAALAVHPHTHLVERLAEVPPICAG